MNSYFRRRFGVKSPPLAQTDALPEVNPLHAADAPPAVTRLSAAVAAVRVPVSVFFVSRAGILLVMYLSLVLFGKPGGYQVFPQNLFVDGLVRWDAYRYADIATQGYTNQPDENNFRDTSWFPLYPYASAAVGRVVGNNFVGGLIVANLSYLIGLILLYHLTLLHFDAATARRAIILLSIFPFSFFFSAMYSEALFFATAVAAFYLGEKRHWLAAAICAGLAAATSLVGFSVLIGLLLLYLEQARAERRRLRPDILWLAVGLLGPVAVMALMQQVSGNPLQFLSAENLSPFEPLYRLSKIVDTVRQVFGPSVFVAGKYFGMDLIHIVTLVVFVVVAALSWRALPRKAYVVWSWLMVLMIALAWPVFGRNVLPMFPLFMTLAVLLSKRLRFQAWAFLSTVGLAVFSMVFALWRYVA